MNTRKLTRGSVALVAGLIASIATLPAIAARAYTATPLLPVDNGYAINNAGQITGRAFTTYAYRAFLYSDGVTLDLGTLGGTYSWGFGINDSGQVTGTANTDVSSLAFLYSAGAMINLGTLALDSTGYSVNNSAQVTGFFNTDNGNNGNPFPHTHAFLYSGGTMTDLGTLGGLSSVGYGINNSGEITGSAWINNSPQQHAFIYTGGVMHDIGTLGGSNSQGFAINDLGQVTGEAQTNLGGLHAFLYSSGTMIDLGTFGGPSAGLGINRHGEVVGTAALDYNFHNRAFLYADGTLYDLNSLVVSGLPPDQVLVVARGINDRGQIVAGSSCTHIGCVAGTYLLDPITSPPAPIVYKPLAPCRIMDTRMASPASGVQGPVVGDALYNLPGFIPAGSNWGLFGGSGTSDCGLNDSVGINIQAVAMVITILNPNFDAFLGVGDINDLNTTLSTVALNYTAGQGLSTLYFVPQTSRNTIYFALPTDLSAQLIFDVVGYLVTSDATALQCATQASAASTISASGGTGSATSPVCSAAYTLTSGSCDSDSFAMKLVSDKASGQAWYCSATNSGGTDAHLTATANCCRVPGK